MVISRSSWLRPQAFLSLSTCTARLALGCSQRRTGSAAAQGRSLRRAVERHRMDRAAPDQPDRPYRGRRGGANRRVQVFYNAQDLASGAIRRLVRIQGQTPNFIIPRRQYDQNDPYVALIVNVDWYGVQSLLADEITRLAPYIPGLDVQVQAARRNRAGAGAQSCRSGRAFY